MNKGLIVGCLMAMGGLAHATRWTVDTKSMTLPKSFQNKVRAAIARSAKDYVATQENLSGRKLTSRVTVKFEQQDVIDASKLPMTVKTGKSIFAAHAEILTGGERMATDSYDVKLTGQGVEIVPQRGWIPELIYGPGKTIVK